MEKNHIVDDCIDFLITWVDDTDTEWLKQRNKYAGTNPEDLAEYRYRDWGTLKFLFRGIEKFTPRINNVFFVTCGHCPPWLNLNHPKLRFIKHEDYIPQKYLPTFNARTIELNFHRIKELSEHFVYFNDDMFILRDMNQTDFFESGMPKHIAGIEAIANNNENYAHVLLNDIQLINRHFSHLEVLKKNKTKWFYPGYGIKILIKTFFLQYYSCFVGIKRTHLPNPLLKSTISKLWEDEYEILDASSMTKFRTEKDVNQFIFSWYDIASGNFMPGNIKIGRCIDIKNKNLENIINTIVGKKMKLICINECDASFDFQKVRLEIINAFEKILPEKSQFEK